MTAKENANWDTLFRDALIFDGHGGMPWRGDLAIRDGRVAAQGIGLPETAAAEVVDAKGCWLTPGFFDIHTHLDLEVELEPALAEVVRHGTTSVVVSNCSLGIAFGAQRVNGQDPIVDCFARVENVPKPVLKQVADKVSWNDSAAYLEHFRDMPLGPNIVPMIPHSMLRIEVMGLRDSVSRDPTPDELERMEALLDKGMHEGYVGFSTDALPFHYLANDPNRRVRIPGQFGGHAELRRLTDVVRRHRRVWQATPPKNDKISVFRTFFLSSGRFYGEPLKCTAVAALDVATNKTILPLARLITRLLNSRLFRGHFRFQALAAPFRVFADGMLTPLAEETPALRELNEPDLEDRDGRMSLLNDPAYIERFRRMWYLDKRGFGLARIKRLVGMSDDTLSRELGDMIMTDRPHPLWAGDSLAQIYQRLLAWQGDGAAAKCEEEAEVFGRLPNPIGDDCDFMLALLREFDTDLRWYVVAANRDPERLKQALFDPLILPGFNDSGAHLTNMAFFDCNLRGLQLAAGESLACAARHVMRLTREPASFFGLDRGTLDPGQAADLLLIDPQALANYDSEAHTRLEYRELFGHEQMVNRSDGVVREVYIAGRKAWAADQPAELLGKQQLGQVLTVNSGEEAVAA